MPQAWMEATHRWLELGELPDAPIVGYLTRSVSCLYAVLGGLLWVVSFDVRRHRHVLQYQAVACLAFGVLLIWIDLHVGLPGWWVWGEGPWVIAFGVIILALLRRIEPWDGVKEPKT
jgi:hypothetical protein